MSETKSNFVFELGQSVNRAADGKEGIIDGRAEYSRQVPQYNFQYKDNHGDLQWVWLPASELSAQ
jgi:hypothetical protein